MSAPSRVETVVIDSDSDSGSDAPTTYTINGRVYSAQNSNSNSNNNNETTANAQQQSNVLGQQHSNVSTANNNSNNNNTNNNTVLGQQNVGTPALGVRFNERLQFSDQPSYGGTNGNNNNNGNVSTDNNNNNNNNNNTVQGQQNVNAATPTGAATGGGGNQHLDDALSGTTPNSYLQPSRLNSGQPSRLNSGTTRTDSVDALAARLSAPSRRRSTSGGGGNEDTPASKRMRCDDRVEMNDPNKLRQALCEDIGKGEKRVFVETQTTREGRTFVVGGTAADGAKFAYTGPRCFEVHQWSEETGVQYGALTEGGNKIDTSETQKSPGIIALRDLDRLTVTMRAVTEMGEQKREHDELVLACGYDDTTAWADGVRAPRIPGGDLDVMPFEPDFNPAAFLKTKTHDSISAQELSRLAMHILRGANGDTRAQILAGSVLPWCGTGPQKTVHWAVTLTLWATLMITRRSITVGMLESGDFSGNKKVNLRATLKMMKRSGVSWIMQILFINPALQYEQLKGLVRYKSSERHKELYEEAILPTVDFLIDNLSPLEEDWTRTVLLDTAQARNYVDDCNKKVKEGMFSIEKLNSQDSSDMSKFELQEKTKGLEFGFGVLCQLFMKEFNSKWQSERGNQWYTTAWQANPMLWAGLHEDRYFQLELGQVRSPYPRSFVTAVGINGMDMNIPTRTEKERGSTGELETMDNPSGERPNHLDLLASRQVFKLSNFWWVLDEAGEASDLTRMAPGETDNEARLLRCGATDQPQVRMDDGSWRCIKSASVSADGDADLFKNCFNGMVETPGILVDGEWRAAQGGLFAATATQEAAGAAAAPAEVFTGAEHLWALAKDGTVTSLSKMGTGDKASGARLLRDSRKVTQPTTMFQPQVMMKDGSWRNILLGTTADASAKSATRGHIAVTDESKILFDYFNGMQATDGEHADGEWTVPTPSTVPPNGGDGANDQATATGTRQNNGPSDQPTEDGAATGGAANAIPLFRGGNHYWSLNDSNDATRRVAMVAGDTESETRILKDGPHELWQVKLDDETWHEVRYAVNRGEVDALVGCWDRTNTTPAKHSNGQWTIDDTNGPRVAPVAAAPAPAANDGEDGAAADRNADPAAAANAGNDGEDGAAAGHDGDAAAANADTPPAGIPGTPAPAIVTTTGKEGILSSIRRIMYG